ncbi:hypothetical protein P3T37_000967 [Kitasatospora sp. MAA4]|uniref:DUF6348 family protein n=1 Tax=Kitasatospora sp. MAA4 TaxID=3035093 RepID=UPI002473661A|nr:DUF6348 family protein [Kitasatospora sp. MAA4]MDH6131593.1 hypothetical protein [Kitasatospora sp. MAA4]
MGPEQRLAVIQRGVIREMARYGREFTVDGAVLRGPGTTAVAVREHPSADGSAGHVDLGFVLRLGSGETPVVWDCAAGLGTTEEEKLDSAVRMWAATTAATVVELLDHQGRYGDHRQPDELPGWYAVQGPATVFGFGSADLSDWLGEHELLPALAASLAPELTDPLLNGVKVFLGGRAGDEVAEVRVNGTVAQAASQALGALDWPRSERFCWARLFILLTADQAVLETARAAEHPARTAQPALVAADPATVRRGPLRRWWQARRAGQ